MTDRLGEWGALPILRAIRPSKWILQRWGEIYQQRGIMPRLEKPSPAATQVSFLVLPENRFAHEAISTLGEPGPEDERLRPIYLFGPAGVGKSHLARQAVRLFRARQPDAQIESITAAQFAAEFAEASSNKSISLFQAATRHFDLFVIEDLQALERRKQTQIQLLLLCDELAARGCQIIWTSRHSPGEMPQFMRKLVSRFRSGVLAQIRPPGPASRLKLLQHFSASRRKPLSEAAARLLATKLPVTPRELWATLTQLDALARAQRRPIDSDLIRKFLEHEIVPLKPRIEEICMAVARQFSMTLGQLRSRKQTRDVVYSRQIAMLTARALTDHSLEEIGHYLGGRDHSTVLHACQRLLKVLATDVELRFDLSQLETAFGVAEGTIGANLAQQT